MCVFKTKQTKLKHYKLLPYLSLRSGGPAPRLQWACGETGRITPMEKRDKVEAKMTRVEGFSKALSTKGTIVNHVLTVSKLLLLRVISLYI